MTDRFERDLLRGSLDLMVLSLLAEEPRYGYSLQQKIRESSGDQIQLPAGTLYPLLHKLENEGWIRSSWDESTGRKRKWYELTKSGRKRLASQAAQWNRYVGAIRGLLEGVVPPPPKTSRYRFPMTGESRDGGY